MEIKSDIQIAQETEMTNIQDIALQQASTQNTSSFTEITRQRLITICLKRRRMLPTER